MVRCRSSVGEVSSTARRLWNLIALVSGLLAFLAFATAAYGAGELDPTFDGDGRVITDFGAGEEGQDIAIQADGKVVVAGVSYAANDFALARYNTDGSLDTSLDGDGRVVTDLGSADRGSAVAIQGDGKIVAAGRSGAGLDANFALARYNPDGSLDTTFDGDGKVVTDFGGLDSAFDVAIQSDGKIVAVGWASGDEQDFALLRYNADGSLDPSFDGDGKVSTGFAVGVDDTASGVAIQADGKIVVAGASGAGTTPYNFALARYNSNGSVDSTFDGDGKLLTDFGSFDHGEDVAIQADGKIVVAGTSAYSLNDFALARYNLDGSLDQTFDGDGRVTTTFGQAFGLAIHGNGKIVVAGLTGTGTDPTNFALARYNVDGSLDSSFDGDGTLASDFGTADSNDLGFGVAIQADGKIVVAGSSGVGTNNPANFALARYLGTSPQLSINDLTRLEGNAGLTAFTFIVSLSHPSSKTITVSRQTADGSASAPSDYTALGAAILTFSPGQTTKTVTVNVRGEVAIEPNETFFLNLSAPTNATIADNSGKGTIVTDDLSASSPCTITGTAGNDVLTGTPGNDVVCGGGGDDQLYGLDGADVLKGEGGNDLQVGGNGVDLLVGATGADDLRGMSGNDTLRGGDNDDTLNGGANSDALFGERGKDSLNTQDGVSANDSADGGSSSDTCVFDSGDFVTSCP
jgi:uncharacterized delta-60 repeat protein